MKVSNIIYNHITRK